MTGGTAFQMFRPPNRAKSAHRAVALHRVEDVVDRHAMRHAGVEVIHAIGRRRVDDAGAVVGRGVVGQVDRRQAPVAGVHIIQRMLELQPAQLVALGRGQHIAGQAVALQALVDQHIGQHQVSARRVDQRVEDLGVEVERLVGRDGPGGGGPDHGEGVLGQGSSAETEGRASLSGSAP
jgi:hypothetical protein